MPNTSRLLEVHHFGPDPTSVGGMASVIRVLTENSIGGDIVSAYPTWSPQSSYVTSHMFATSLQVLRALPTTQVAHIHLSERGSFLREGSLVKLARRRALVTVVTIHGASFVPFANRRPRLVSSILRCADLVTCLDQDTLGVVRRSAPRVRSEIVPNPVFVSDDFAPADATDELVVFAGEVGIRKGADVLYRAWQIVAARRPNARCLMVGPESDLALPLAARLTVVGPVDPSNMTETLRRARVLALPSRAESMPMVLAEAMSLGRPFVSTPVGGIPELAHEGGILVAVEDVAGLADNLTTLLAQPGLARAIGERGRRFCMETRSVPVIDARLRMLYSEATSERDSRTSR